MKKIAVCMIFCLLLCGCSGQQTINQAVDFRNRLTDSAGCKFICTITADYVEKLYSFTMDCGFDSAGNMTFSVIQPDSISGITGEIDQAGGKLTFDEQALAFELMADGYISPVSAPWLFIKTLRGGYIQSCSQEEDGFRITFNDTYSEEALQVDVWMNNESMPVFCEILWKGRRILSLEVSNFSYL